MLSGVKPTHSALTCRHRHRGAEQLHVWCLRLAPARQQQRHRHQHCSQPQRLHGGSGSMGREVKEAGPC